MTDTPEALESREAVAAQAAVLKAAAQKKNTRNGAAVLASVLALAALAVSGLVYWQNQLQQNQTLQLQAALDSTQKNLAAQLQDGEQTQQQSREQLQGAINILQEQLQSQDKAHGDALAEQKAQLQQLSEIDRSDWQLAEAEYLLQLASQRLLLLRDTAGVGDLLQSVDQILAAINDSELFAVRKLLAEELAAVRTAQDIDRQGLYLRIAALAKSAEQLPIVLPGSDTFSEAGSNAESASNASASWLDNLFGGMKQALNKLGAYVRIQHRDSPLPATLAPEQESLVRRTLQLQFEQAQFALLAANQTLYTMSLQKAHDWLFDLYLADRAATNRVIKEIDALMQQSVVQDLPSVGAAHSALKRYIELRHRTAKTVPQKTSPAEVDNSPQEAAQ